MTICSRTLSILDLGHCRQVLVSFQAQVEKFKGIGKELIHINVCPSLNEQNDSAGYQGSKMTEKGSSLSCVLRALQLPRLLQILRSLMTQFNSLIARLRNQRTTDYGNVDFGSFKKTLDSKLGK